MNEGKSQGMDRALQRQAALERGQESQEKTQVEAVGPAAPGPALEQAREQALGRGSYSEHALAAHFLILASNHAPGPKPISSLMAEDNYRAALKSAVAPAGETCLA